MNRGRSWPSCATWWPSACRPRGRSSAAFMPGTKQPGNIFEATQRELTERYETGRSEAEAEYAAIRREALEKFQSGHEATAAEYAKVREEAIARFEAAEIAAEQERQEAHWEATTIAEAAKGGSGLELHDIQTELDRRWQELQAIGWQAAELLRRRGQWRQFPDPRLQRRDAGATPRPAVHQGPGACPGTVPRAGRPEGAAVLHRAVADDGPVRVPVGRVRLPGRSPAGLGRLEMGGRQRRRRLRDLSLPADLAAPRGPAAFDRGLFAAAADPAGGGDRPAGRAGKGQKRLPASVRRHRRAAQGRDQEGRRTLRRRHHRHDPRQAAGASPGGRNLSTAPGGHGHPARPVAGRGRRQVSAA